MNFLEWANAGLSWSAGDTVEFRLVYEPPPPPVPASCDRGWAAKLTVAYDGASNTEHFNYSADGGLGALSRRNIPHGSTDYTVTEIFRSTVTTGGAISLDFLLFGVTGGELPDGTVLNFGGTGRRLVVGPDSETGTAGQEEWNLIGTGFPAWKPGRVIWMCANLPLRLERAGVDGRYLGLEYEQPLDWGSVPARSAYTVTVDGEARAVTDVFVPVWMSRVVLTLASPVTSGQTVKAAYRPLSDPPLQDNSGLYALPFDGDAHDFPTWTSSSPTPATAPPRTSPGSPGKGRTTGR